MIVPINWVLLSISVSLPSLRTVTGTQLDFHDNRVSAVIVIDDIFLERLSKVQNTFYTRKKSKFLSRLNKQTFQEPNPKIL